VKLHRLLTFQSAVSVDIAHPCYFADPKEIQTSLKRVCDAWVRYLQDYVDQTTNLFEAPELPWKGNERALVSSLAAAIIRGFPSSLAVEEGRVPRTGKVSRGRGDLWATIPGRKGTRFSFYLEAKRSDRSKKPEALLAYFQGHDGVSALYRDYAKSLKNPKSKLSAYVSKRVHEHYVIGLLVTRLKAVKKDSAKIASILHDVFENKQIISMGNKSQGDGLKAGLDAQGKLTPWRHHLVTFGDEKHATSGGGIGQDTYPAGFPPAYALYTSMQPLTLRTGALRAPGDNAYCWVAQSFLDEMAHAAGRDPLEFQLELLSNKKAPWSSGEHDAVGDHEPTGQSVLIPERFKGVLELVAEKSGWAHRSKTPGRGMGIAAWFCHLGYFAEVADVSVDAKNKVTVHQFWAAGDVGSRIINPAAAENISYGGIIEGMSHMGQEITLADGRVEQSNFHNHPLMRMRQTRRLKCIGVRPTMRRQAWASRLCRRPCRR
jgi:hypothetical protein